MTRLCRYARAALGSVVIWLALACSSEPLVYLGEHSERAPIAAVADSPAQTLPDASAAPIETANAAGAAPAVSQPELEPQPEPQPPPRQPEPEPLHCQPDLADCDGARANGCEADLQRSPEHCGVCGNACNTPDCACIGGKLGVSCPSGHADCDGQRSNGCEVDLNTNVRNCGRCQHACQVSGHDAIATMCIAGQCQLKCQEETFPEVDCDHDPSNGCEARLWADPENCGACGKRCRSGTCSSGVCQ